MASIAETTYYTNGNVTVTNARIVLPSQTYAMAGITSVKFDKVSPNRLPPILLLIATLLFLVNQAAHLSIWHFLIALMPSILWLALQKTRYCVQLSSASGESRALASKDKKFVKDVVDSINKAIIERG